MGQVHSVTKFRPVRKGGVCVWGAGVGAAELEEDREWLRLRSIKSP